MKRNVKQAEINQRKTENSIAFEKLRTFIPRIGVRRVSMPPERGIRIMRAIHMKRESRTQCAAFDVESR